jgi:hypothetical protein
MDLHDSIVDHDKNDNDGDHVRWITATRTIRAGCHSV